MKVTFAIFALVFCFATFATPQENDRKLEKSITINAPLADVWNAWTTVDGITSFFAPGAEVDLKVDGLYGIYFIPDAEPGYRGADGMKILEIDKHRTFAFTWNAPPMFPEIRESGILTRVILTFESAGDDMTIVNLVHDKWLKGGDWDKVFDYFDAAWDLVLARLKRSLEVAPIDWTNPWRPEKN